MTLDQAFARLRRLCEPEPPRCLDCTAAFRAMVLTLAEGPALTSDVLMVPDEIVQAERARLHADHPDWPYPPCPLP